MNHRIHYILYHFILYLTEKQQCGTVGESLMRQGEEIELKAVSRGAG